MHKETDQAMKVLIVSDNHMIGAGIRTILENQPNMLVIGEVSTARKAVQLASDEQPRVVLIDLDLCGLDVARLLGDLAKVAGGSFPLVLGSLGNGAFSRMASCSETVGIVLTVQPPAVLVAAIASLCTGTFHIERQRRRPPASFLVNGDRPVKNADHERTIAGLTNREREMVGLVGKGLTNKDIADQVGISEITVRHHLTNIYGKLNVSSRQQLLIVAHQYGLIEVAVRSTPHLRTTN